MSSPQETLNSGHSIDAPTEGSTDNLNQDQGHFQIEAPQTPALESLPWRSTRRLRSLAFYRSADDSVPRVSLWPPLLLLIALCCGLVVSSLLLVI